jgi:hypothetical protein
MTSLDSKLLDRSANDIDALDRSRRHLFVLVIITSSIMLLSQAAGAAFFHDMPPLLSKILILAGVAGSLLFVVFMMRYQRFQMRVHGDPELRKRLDDERVITLRKEAIMHGWVAVLVAVAAGVALAPFVELPDQAVLPVLLLLAVNTPLVSFLIRDRD